MAATSQDKIFFGAAVLLLLASAGWMGLQSSKLARLSASFEGNHPSAAYVPAGIDAPAVSTKTWPLAGGQSTGAEWVYDVFTPPEIYYNGNTKQFSVKRPGTPEVDPVAQLPFGVELLQIKPDVFRLQLVGYVGSEGDYRGTFENTVSGETIIGRAGKTVPSLGLMIKSFNVKRIRIESKESMTTYVTEATALVVDTKTGDEVMLTNKQRHVNGEPFAIFKIDGSEEPVQRRVGESFRVGSATYTVLKLKAEPPAVDVRKEASDLKQPITKTLTPFTPVSPLPAPSAPVPPSSGQPGASTPFPFGT